MSSWLLPRYRNHWIFVQIAVYIAYAFQWGPQCFSSLKFTTCFLLIHSNKNWTNVHNNFWKLKGGGGVKCVCVRQRDGERRKDAYSVCNSSKPPYTQSGPRFPCSENQHKHTMHPHSLHERLFLSLSVSSFSRAGSCDDRTWEPRLSHLRSNRLWFKYFAFGLALFFEILVHVIPVSKYRICRLFPWFLFLSVICSLQLCKV